MSLMLKPRQAVEDEIENWDDEDLDIGGEDFTFRSVSMATTAPSHHRDSISSRMSFRSDFDSNHGDDERQLHLPDEDNETSTTNAIAQAARAGIPIPENIPPSALLGGTIKRLGGRKIQKIITQDDWDEDLEMPEMGQGLKIKTQDASSFPDSLRQVSDTSSPLASSARELQPAPVFDLTKTLKARTAAKALDLDRFKDDDDDLDFFGDGGDTIKVAKSRPSKPLANVSQPAPQNLGPFQDDDFEADLQLPEAGLQLSLSSRKDIPGTPVSNQDEFDDWAEGSLGTRFGGTRRDGRSARSSSASALSPSVSSSLTVESEDEGLDGLVLPIGPLNFDDKLKKLQAKQAAEPDELFSKPKRTEMPPTDENFMTGLEFDGDVFDSSKLTLNRNIKVKTARQTSPQRPKAAVSLTFTNKPSPPTTSRLPRPLGGHERVPSSLAPVSESGGPILTKTRRSQSRLGGTQHSILPTPSTPSRVVQPGTPRHRDLAQKSSLSGLRNEPTTTNAQLLKLKRSMPAMRSHPSPAKPMGMRYERPPSRTDTSRPISMSRPKTPTERDRSGAETSMSQLRKPFLPAGVSTVQSQHITIKSSRHLRGNGSESSTNSSEFRPSSRAVSRTTMRSPSPSRSRTARGAEALTREAAAKRQITKPVRRRHFGDGFELDAFDDLPTSHRVEQRYVKDPVGQGAPKVLRNKMSFNTLPSRTMTPAPPTPIRQDNLPRFARDTNASRLAREQVLSQRAPSGAGHAPLTALTNHWKAQISARTGLNTIGQPPKAKSKKIVQQKPHLIKPMGDVGKSAKSIKGMVYNPLAFRWEGNENDLSPFDAPAPSPSTASVPTHIFREKETSTPRPALITNINASQGVQVVGGMVFDPVKMCWLKMPNSTHRRAPSRPGTGHSTSSAPDTMDDFDAFEDEEDDVFKDVPDLEDKPSPSKEGNKTGGGRKSMDSGTGLKDEWLVGEEFDVGPEFIRRQREEEERWRRKCEKWLGNQRAILNREKGDEWRWSIRDVIGGL